MIKFIVFCLYYFTYLSANVVPKFFNTSKLNEIDSTKSCELDVNPFRRKLVKDGFLHAWNGYKKYAWGKDELKPLTNSSNERFQSWGASLVDSLSSLWIMDLKTEFDEAVKEVEKIDFTKAHGTVNFFETTIRYLGGLISAYDLSGRKVLLDQAVTLGDKLMGAFDTPSGIPSNELTPNFRPASNTPVLAEVGTVQLEFTRLSQLTGDPKYAEVSQKVFHKLYALPKRHKGLYPLKLSYETGNFVTDEISFGALGDSFYEYLIKLYVLTGKKDTFFKTMYEESMEGLLELVRTDYEGYKYFGVLRNDQFSGSLDHLALFVPGMLQYGDHVLNQSKYSKLALELVETGYALYKSTPTHLGPEGVQFYENAKFTITFPKNNLRPELLESLYYSYKFTKDPKYRDYAWNIFQAFERYSKTPSGYSVYRNVEIDAKSVMQEDVMESFFFAETLKYLYLIFCEADFIDLDNWVFTTEGHPLKIKK